MIVGMDSGEVDNCVVAGSVKKCIVVTIQLRESRPSAVSFLGRDAMCCLESRLHVRKTAWEIN